MLEFKQNKRLLRFILSFAFVCLLLFIAAANSQIQISVDSFNYNYSSLISSVNIIEIPNSDDLHISISGSNLQNGKVYLFESECPDILNTASDGTNILIKYSKTKYNLNYQNFLSNQKKFLSKGIKNTGYRLDDISINIIYSITYLQSNIKTQNEFSKTAKFSIDKISNIKNYHEVWEGIFTPKLDGKYRFWVNSDDSIRIYIELFKKSGYNFDNIEDNKVVDFYGYSVRDEFYNYFSISASDQIISKYYPLEKDQKYRFKIYHVQGINNLDHIKVGVEVYNEDYIIDTNKKPEARIVPIQIRPKFQRELFQFYVTRLSPIKFFSFKDSFTNPTKLCEINFGDDLSTILICLQKIENNVVIAKLPMDSNDKYLVGYSLNLNSAFNDQNTISYSKYVSWNSINKSNFLNNNNISLYDESNISSVSKFSILIYFDRIKTNYINNLNYIKYCYENCLESSYNNFVDGSKYIENYNAGVMSGIFSLKIATKNSSLLNQSVSFPLAVDPNNLNTFYKSIYSGKIKIFRKIQSDFIDINVILLNKEDFSIEISDLNVTNFEHIIKEANVFLYPIPSEFLDYENDYPQIQVVKDNSYSFCDIGKCTTFLQSILDMNIITVFPSSVRADTVTEIVVSGINFDIHNTHVYLFDIEVSLKQLISDKIIFYSLNLNNVQKKIPYTLTPLKIISGNSIKSVSVFTVRGIAQDPNDSVYLIICDPSCNECIINEKRCITCAQGYIRRENDSSYGCYKDANFFMDSNSKLYYYKQDNLFKLCDFSCINCLNTSTNCLKCNDNYYNFEDNIDNPDNINVCKLPNTFSLVNYNNLYKNVTGFIDETNKKYYYLDSINNYLIFRNCYNSCKKCTQKGTDLTHYCIECRENFYKKIDNDLNCYIYNIDGYYLDLFKKIYLKCPTGCLRCANYETCLECQDGFLRFYLNSNLSFICHNQAPTGFYIDALTNSFKKCSLKCLDCSKSDSNCLNCNSENGFYPAEDLDYNKLDGFNSDKCFKICPPNYYLDIKNKICKITQVLINDLGKKIKEVIDDNSNINGEPIYKTNTTNSIYLSKLSDLISNQTIKNSSFINKESKYNSFYLKI